MIIHGEASHHACAFVYGEWVKDDGVRKIIERIVLLPIILSTKIKTN